jgi:hypothetical protein
MSNRLLNVEQMEVNGHVISWVGECPWTNGVCFGTNEGTLEIPPDLKATANLNAGAINAIAFSGELVAISSTAEVTLWARTTKEPLLLEKLALSFEGGAHGIVASAPGVFLATLGDDGLLLLSVDASRNATARVARHVSASEYFYKIVPFINQPGCNLLPCAARRDGLLVITATNGIPRPPVICYRFGEHDIIDVCTLNHPQYPYAVACLSRSCEIFIVPDVRSNEPPYEVRFADIKGTAYALAAGQDHLFLLTSEAFICFPRVISRMLQQAPLSSMATPVLPIGASDMFLIGQHSIALLTDGGVHFITVAELVGGTRTETPLVVGSKNEQSPLGDQTRQPILSRFTGQESTLDLILEDPMLV